MAYEFETKRYPNMPRRGITHKRLMGKEAFEEGKRFAQERKHKYTAEDINNFCLNPPSSDDYTRGFIEGLRS